MYLSNQNVRLTVDPLRILADVAGIRSRWRCSQYLPATDYIYIYIYIYQSTTLLR